MGAPLDTLYASDGVGPAVRATISSDRLPGDMDIITDTVANWPHKGIATSGTPDDNGIIIPSTECIFEYVLSGTIIHITGFAPGYYDIGHTINQICILKPTSYHNDSIVDVLLDSGSSVEVGPTPPVAPADGDLWGDTSDSSLNDIVKAVGSLMYPIGSYYGNETDSRNPSVILGFGTWARQTGALYGYSTTAGSPYNVTGGTVIGEDKHTMALGELATHTHQFKWRVNFPRGTGSLATNDLGGDALLVSDNMPGGDSASGYDWSGGTDGNRPTGSSTPFNIISTGTVGYWWKRTA